MTALHQLVRGRPSLGGLKMYTMAIHVNQVMGVTVLAVSLTETNDDGSAYLISTAHASSDLLASADEDPLWIFFEQTNDCLSRVLSAGRPGPGAGVRPNDGLDGGWRGAGNQGQPERSEDRCSE